MVGIESCWHFHAGKSSKAAYSETPVVYWVRSSSSRRVGLSRRGLNLLPSFEPQR